MLPNDAKEKAQTELGLRFSESLGSGVWGEVYAIEGNADSVVKLSTDPTERLLVSTWRNSVSRGASLAGIVSMETDAFDVGSHEGNTVFAYLRERVEPISRDISRALPEYRVSDNKPYVRQPDDDRGVAENAFNRLGSIGAAIAHKRTPKSKGLKAYSAMLVKAESDYPDSYAMTESLGELISLGFIAWDCKLTNAGMSRYGFPKYFDLSIRSLDAI